MTTWQKMMMEVHTLAPEQFMRREIVGPRLPRPGEGKGRGALMDGAKKVVKFFQPPGTTSRCESGIEEYGATTLEMFRSLTIWNMWVGLAANAKTLPFLKR